MIIPSETEFYSPTEGALPTVVCDTGLSILFANRSAYSSPAMLRWLESGRPELGAAEDGMLAHFRLANGAIYAFPYRFDDLRYTLLVDRMSWEGACVYVIALARGGEGSVAQLATELDGRRMLTACLTPRMGREYMPLMNGGEMIYDLFSELCTMLPQAKDRIRTVGSANVVAGRFGGEALISCVTSLAAAFLSVGSKAVEVSVVPRKGGFAVTFLGECEGSPNLQNGFISLASCFPRALPQIMLCSRLAADCGFDMELCAEEGSKISVTLGVSVYDAGELGFKAFSSDGRLRDCLRAAAELLF